MRWSIVTCKRTRRRVKGGRVGPLGQHEMGVARNGLRAWRTGEFHIWLYEVMTPMTGTCRLITDAYIRCEGDPASPTRDNIAHDISVSPVTVSQSGSKSPPPQRPGFGPEKTNPRTPRPEAGKAFEYVRRRRGLLSWRLHSARRRHSAHRPRGKFPFQKRKPNIEGTRGSRYRYRVSARGLGVPGRPFHVSWGRGRQSHARIRMRMRIRA